MLASSLAFAVALFAVARVRWPSREEAIRRVEGVSGVRHRPASSYEDTLSLNAEDARTAALWRAHRQRLAALLARLRVGRPEPRTDRYDPFALRALLLLGVFVLTIVVGDSAADRLWSAFRLSPLAKGAEARPPGNRMPPPVYDQPAELPLFAPLAQTEVREAPAVRRGIAHRLKGEGVSCRISKQFDADTVKVAAAVRDPPGGDRLPACLVLGVQRDHRDRTVLVEEAVHEVRVVDPAVPDVELEVDLRVLARQRPEATLVAHDPELNRRAGGSRRTGPRRPALPAIRTALCARDRCGLHRFLDARESSWTQCPQVQGEHDHIECGKKDERSRRAESEYIR